MARKLEVVISGDTSQLERAFRRGAAESETFGSRLQHLGSTMASLGVKMVAAGAAAAGISGLAGIGFMAVDAASKWEQYGVVLGNVLAGGEVQAKQMLSWLGEFAKKTPYELDEVVQAAVKLSAYGIDATQVLQTLGDTASSMGKDLNEAVEALADAQTGEFERLKEFGLKALDMGNLSQEQLAKIPEEIKATGDTAVLYTDKTGKEQIAVVDRNNREMITSTLMGIWNSRYQGGMEKLSHTWAGIWSNIKDGVSANLRSIGLALLPHLEEWGLDLSNWLSNTVTPAVSDFSSKLAGIWDRKDLTITAKLNASWDELWNLATVLGVNEDKAQRIKGDFEGLGHFIIGTEDLVIVLAYCFESLAEYSNIAILSIKMQFADWRRAMYETEADFNSMMSTMTFGEWEPFPDTGPSLNNAKKDFESYGKELDALVAKHKVTKDKAENYLSSAIDEFGKIGGQSVKAGQAITEGQAIGMQQGLGPLNAAAAGARATAASAGMVNLGPAGAGIVTGMGTGMWAGKPQVDGAAGAIRGSAASAGDVDLFSKGASIARSLADGMWSHYSAIEGWVTSTKSLVGSIPGGPASFGYSPIPGFASGTNYAPGGLAIVGESGPELVNLPRGSQVIPMSSSSKSTGSKANSITFTPGAIQINGATSPQATADAVYRMVVQRLENKIRRMG